MFRCLWCCTLCPFVQWWTDTHLHKEEAGHDVGAGLLQALVFRKVPHRPPLCWQLTVNHLWGQRSLYSSVCKIWLVVSERYVWRSWENSWDDFEVYKWIRNKPKTISNSGCKWQKVFDQFVKKITWLAPPVSNLWLQRVTLHPSEFQGIQDCI